MSNNLAITFNGIRLVHKNVVLSTSFLIDHLLIKFVIEVLSHV